MIKRILIIIFKPRRTKVKAGDGGQITLTLKEENSFVIYKYFISL